jgi:hypothetical protein
MADRGLVKFESRSSERWLIPLGVILGVIWIVRHAINAL